MVWNWQIPGWPIFRSDAATLAPLEQRFLLSSGEILGAVRWYLRYPLSYQDVVDLLVACPHRHRLSSDLSTCHPRDQLPI